MDQPTTPTGDTSTPTMPPAGDTTPAPEAPKEGGDMGGGNMPGGTPPVA